MYIFAHLNNNHYCENYKWEKETFYAWTERDCIMGNSRGRKYKIDFYNQPIKKQKHIITNCTDDEDETLMSYYVHQTI